MDTRNPLLAPACENRERAKHGVRSARNSTVERNQGLPRRMEARVAPNASGMLEPLAGVLEFPLGFLCDPRQRAFHLPRRRPPALALPPTECTFIPASKPD